MWRLHLWLNKAQPIKFKAMMKPNLVLLFIIALGCNEAKQPIPAAAPPVQKEIQFEQLSDKYLPFQESLNGPAGKFATVEGSQITLKAEKQTDFFIEPGTPPYEFANAPLLLKSVDNTKPFTFSCKTTPVHQVKYDAGMAFIFVDEKKWLKFAFEADERMNKRLVTVKTAGYSDDNNHDAVKSNYVYLKISSDTKVIGFYYSLDNQSWQLVRVFKNEYPSVIRLGIGTQSPAGEGNSSVFEEIQFSRQAVKDFRLGI
jgi:regulation of enolase protein 1 (concanavalin A-like superfamily)